MALRELNIEWKHVKSYATRERLMKKIEEDAALYPEHNDRFVVVQTPEGRWTAIVQLDMSKGGYIGRYDFLKL